MPDNQFLPPPVTWAQRKSILFLTFCVEDCKNPEIRLESNKIYFKGEGGTGKIKYENTLELYGEIDAEKSRYFVRDRVVEFIIAKKEEGPFWPHLLKQKMKMHWLKVDFTKWKDEDESDDEPQEGGGGGGGGGGMGMGMGMGGPGGPGGAGGADFENMMRQMGGLGGGAGPMGERPSLDDLDDESEDSDDNGIPDLE